MPGQFGRRDAGKQVIQRQHRVRLAAAEVGLQLHDRVAALAGQPPHGADQHLLQALGEVGAAEELHRVAVFVRAFAQMHLPQIGGELGLLVAAAGHVLVRRHHLAPGLEAAGHAAFDGGAGALALLAAHLLVEAHAQQFHLHLLDLVGLRGGDRRQQAPGGVERAVGVVAGERLLMRPLVAHVAQFADQAALGVPERLAEDVVPLRPTSASASAAASHSAIAPCRPAESRRRRSRRFASNASPLPYLRLELALDERREAGFQQLQRLADAFVVGDGHGLFLIEQVVGAGLDRCAALRAPAG